MQMSRKARAKQDALITSASVTAQSIKTFHP
jgi:hypothetical protein